MSTFMTLARKQAELFQNNHVVWMDAFVGSDCIRHIMLVAYNILVKDRKMKRIEDMLEDEKRNIWLTTEEFSKGRLDSGDKADMCRGLLSLEYILTSES